MVVEYLNVLHCISSSGPMSSLPLLNQNAESEESGVLNVSAMANSLNLVLRDEGLMKFVK